MNYSNQIVLHGFYAVQYGGGNQHLRSSLEHRHQRSPSLSLARLLELEPVIEEPNHELVKRLPGRHLVNVTVSVTFLAGFHDNFRVSLAQLYFVFAKFLTPETVWSPVELVAQQVESLSDLGIPVTDLSASFASKDLLVVTLNEMNAAESLELSPALVASISAELTAPPMTLNCSLQLVGFLRSIMLAKPSGRQTELEE